MANWRTRRTKRNERRPHSFLHCITENNFHFNLWIFVLFLFSIGNGHIFIFVHRLCCLPTAAFLIAELENSFIFFHLFNYKMHKFALFPFFVYFQISFGRLLLPPLLLTIIASSQIWRCTRTLTLMCRAT